MLGLAPGGIVVAITSTSFWLRQMEKKKKMSQINGQAMGAPGCDLFGR
jgi:hypothetical protein